MADLTDVTAYIYGRAIAAVYPGTTTQPSVANMDVRIYEGWPLPDKLDKDMAGLKDDNVTKRAGGPCANVSIYPMAGQGNEIYQVLNETYVIAPAVHGMNVSVSGTLITVVGQPTQGEYLTLVADGNVVFSQGGATTAAVLAALAVQAAPIYPGVVATATTLNLPVGHSLVVRQGAVALLGRTTHRQRHQVMVTVWAPNQVARKQLAKAIDVLIKENIKITLSDTSQATICYNRTNTSDEQQASNIYRRDLIYDVDYATLETFPGYEVTSVNTTIASATGNVQANAIT